MESYPLNGLGFISRRVRVVLIQMESYPLNGLGFIVIVNHANKELL